jgi:hypothetical protein
MTVSVCVALRVESTQCSIAWLCYIGNVYSSTESRSATWHSMRLSLFRRPGSNILCTVRDSLFLPFER